MLWESESRGGAAESIEENLTEFSMLSNNIRELIIATHLFITGSVLPVKHEDKTESNEIKPYIFIPFSSC